MNNLKEFFQWFLDGVKIWVKVEPWEQGIRVRKGRQIKKLKAGLYFKIPYIDSVYIQEVRSRSCDLSIQTLTTKDLKTLTINSSIMYSITNIEKLYNTLYQPEATLSNIAASKVANFVFTHTLAQITPEHIQTEVLKLLNSVDYGIKFESYQITNFAAVRTYRLIQDGQSWTSDSLKMTDKK
ncbi:MAG: SPFH domain-containing protein [Bacteroidota bacterium]